MLVRMGGDAHFAHRQRAQRARGKARTGPARSRRSAISPIREAECLAIAVLIAPRAAVRGTAGMRQPMSAAAAPKNFQKNRESAAENPVVPSGKTMYRGRPPRNLIIDRHFAACERSSREVPQRLWRDHLPPRCGSHRVQVACSDRDPWRVRSERNVRQQALPMQCVAETLCP